MTTKQLSLIDAAELAYTEMAFTLHDVMCPDRRKDDLAWSERRSKTLARVADDLRAAIDREAK